MYLFSGCRLLQARSQFKSRSTANNVEILVPVPSDADSPKFKTSTGSAKWVPEKSAVQWNIKSFPVSVKCSIFNSFWFFIFICVSNCRISVACVFGINATHIGGLEKAHSLVHYHLQTAVSAMKNNKPGGLCSSDMQIGC